MLTGGLVGNILLAAKGEDIGQASLDFIRKEGYQEFIPSSQALLERYGDKIQLPTD